MKGFHLAEIKCIKCGAKLSEGDKLPNYPSSFTVYKCPICGYENEWWTLYGFGKGTNLESIIRALALDSFLQKKEIRYPQVVQHIQEKYEDAKYSVDSIQGALNRVFRDVLKGKGISADRYPSNRLSDEKYNKIRISSNNTLDVFFNKRIIRQWDLQHLIFDFDLHELKKKIKSDPVIRYKDRWLAACNYFLDRA